MPHFTLTPENEPPLRDLIARLLHTNTRFNLTSVRNPDEAWTKHILDSLQGLETGLFEAEKSAVDVGSGAGFPGLPLALARPAMKWSFLEATRKKCGFIEETSAHLELKTRVLNGRAEEIGQDERFRATFDIAIARAVGSLTEVAEYCLPLVKLRGFVVLWRGKDAALEAKEKKWPLARLGGVVSEIRPYTLPLNEMTYHLVVIEKKSPTPHEFPRRVGIPKGEPLI